MDPNSQILNATDIVSLFHSLIVPMKTGMNTLQRSQVVFLNGLLTSQGRQKQVVKVYFSFNEVVL